jgi:hypothetical protein
LQHETPKEIRRSLWWSWKQFLLRRMDYMTWSIATPMPGAPLQTIVDKHGLKSATQKCSITGTATRTTWASTSTPLGISEKTKMRLLRAGIISKALLRDGQRQLRLASQLLPRRRAATFVPGIGRSTAVESTSPTSPTTQTAAKMPAGATSADTRSKSASASVIKATAAAADPASMRNTPLTTKVEG